MSNVISGEVPENGTLVGRASVLLGKDGESAYAIACRNGFEGTEEEWLDSLNGGLITVDEQLYRSGHAADAAVVGEKFKQTSSEISLQKARIDNLATLPDGSTTGDAELIDARIGADGVTYGNLGEANRTQFSTLNKAVDAQLYKNEPIVSSGDYIEGDRLAFVPFNFKNGNYYKIEIEAIETVLKQNQSIRLYLHKTENDGLNGAKQIASFNNVESNSKVKTTIVCDEGWNYLLIRYNTASGTNKVQTTISEQYNLADIDENTKSNTLKTTGFVTPEMFGAVGDGDEDDRIPLQNAIDYVSENRGTKLIISKIYLVGSSGDANNNCLQMKSNVEIEFINNGVIRSSRDMKTDEYRVINIGSGIRNVYLHGNGTVVGDRISHSGNTGEFGHCIHLGSCSDVTIDGLTCSQAWGDGITVNYGAENIRIINCKFNNNSRNNIALIFAKKTLIDKCTFDMSNWRTLPGANIDIEPSKSDHHNSDIIITNCLFVAGNNNNLCVYNSLGSNKNIIIANNILHAPIGVYSSSEPETVPEFVNVIGNILIGNDAYIYARANNCVIANNTLQLPSGTNREALDIQGEKNIVANNWTR